MDRIMKVMISSIIVNTLLSLLKIIFGFISKSGALIADGIHSLSDLLTDFFAIFGNFMAKKPADLEHPYGHGKIEYLTSIGISLVILFLGFNIISSSANSKALSSSLIVIIVSIVTIIFKYLLSSYIIKKGYLYKNNILIASGKESKADVISSLVVFISAILVYFSKYIDVLKYADKVAAIVVGILIIKTGFIILKENISIIIGEQEVSGDDVDMIKDILHENKEIKNIDSLVVLKFGYCYKVSIEVSMNENLTLLKCHEIIDHLEKKIREKIEKVEYVMIHANPYEDKSND